jgi:hypothetical protein
MKGTYVDHIHKILVCAGKKLNLNAMATEQLVCEAIKYTKNATIDVNDFSQALCVRTCDLRTGSQDEGITHNADHGDDNRYVFVFDKSKRQIHAKAYSYED